MRRIATFRAAALLGLALMSMVLAAPAWAGIIVFNVTLNGASESPPTGSPGTGTGVVTFDTLAHTMRVQVTFSDLLGNVTASHIHCCTAVPGTGNVGVATVLPTFTGFPTGVTDGTYDHTFDMSVIAGSFNPTFVTNNGGSTATAEAALIAGALDGKAYLNIHTNLLPGGEIRGFLTAVPEPASLGLLGAGLTGLAFARRRRGRASAGN